MKHDRQNGFTRNQRLTMQLMRQGVPQVEIARQMNLSPSTVYNRTLKLRKRLGLYSNTQLIQEAKKL